MSFIKNSIFGTFRNPCQLADQFRYFNFSSYLVIFRTDQSKKTHCTLIGLTLKTFAASALALHISPNQ